MPDFPFSFLLHGPFPAVQSVIGIAVPAVLHGMQQIEVEIVQPAAIKLFIENAIPIFFLAHAPGGQLGGDHETVPRITLRQRILNGFFGITAMIHIGRVKIIHAGFHIGVHHPADVIQVDFSILLRQPHEAEAQFGHGVQINAHCFLLLF